MRHLIVLSLLLVMVSPIAAQELATPAPGVHVTLDPVTGILAWSPKLNHGGVKVRNSLQWQVPGTHNKIEQICAWLTHYPRL